MDIGAFVREQRRLRKLSQTQLAALAGVGLNFVYQMEKNKPTAQLDCVQLVLRALGYELTVTSLGMDMAVSSRAGASARDAASAVDTSPPAARPARPVYRSPWD